MPNSRIAAFSTGNVYPLTPRHARRLDRNRPAGADRRVRRELRRPRTALRLLQPGARHDTRHRAAELCLRAAVRRARRSGAANSRRRADRPHDGRGERHLARRRQRHDAPSRSATPPRRHSSSTSPVRKRCRSARCASNSADLLGKPPVFSGSEGADALLIERPARPQTVRLSDSARFERLSPGSPTGSKSGGELLGKPTKFQVRDGKF